MQRRQLLKGIAALALAERLGALQAAWAAGGKLPPPGMHQMTGDVRINGQPASPGTPIKPGDTVTTGPNSQAIYIIGNDAYLQRDRTTVSLAGQAARAGLRVLTGKLLAVFGKGNKQIETPTATIGIRGTGCYIEAETKRSISACVTAKPKLPRRICPISTSRWKPATTINRFTCMPMAAR